MNQVLKVIKEEEGWEHLCRASHGDIAGGNI